jgi:hypothetical protein
MKSNLRPVSIYNFTALLVLYVLVGAIVHLASSNSKANFLAYVFLIFPIQVIFCIVFVIGSISASPNKTSVFYSPKSLGAVFIAQAGVLLMAPADCITLGKTGTLCTTMIETIVKIKVPAFIKLDYIFYAFVVAYLVAIIAFFKDAQIRKSAIPLAPLGRWDRD